MTKQYLILAIITICNYGFSQKVKTLDFDKTCDIIPAYYQTNASNLDEFKDSLLLIINLSRITNGREEITKPFKYSEKIKNESSLIQLSKKVAFSISIARIEEKGKKYYLYCIHLYRKEGKCWEDLNPSGNWTKCDLGTITNGYGFGNQGTSNYVGIQGEIILR